MGKRGDERDRAAPRHRVSSRQRCALREGGWGWRARTQASNITLEQTEGSPALAPAAQRARSALEMPWEDS